MVLFMAVFLCSTLELDKHKFLNDRVGDITGVRILAAPGMVTPQGLNGKGEIVGLADSGLDTGNINDLPEDLQSTPGEMPKVVLLKSWAGRAKPDDPIGHGTHLAGIIAGTGAASDGQYRGIAPGASIYFQGLLNSKGELAPPEDLYRLFEPAYEAGVRIHVNGWGGSPNAYRNVTRQIDAFVRENPDFLPVFGAGNSGPFRGSLTAEANSKNALVIGASETPRPAFSPDANDAHRQADFSSRGPTGDGRMKPDLLVPGLALVSLRSSKVKANFPPNENYNVMSGTSQASAVAGGAAAVLRQYLKEKGFTKPSAALLKASLINGAWVPDEGPTAQFPGIMDLAGTVLALEENTMELVDYKRGLKQGEEVSYKVEVTDNETPFRATLAWTDPAKATGDGKALVNDLDLVVVGPDGTYLGNDFNDRNEPDKENNVEKIYIKAPIPGTYTVKVLAKELKANALSSGSVPEQDFALSYGQPLIRGVVSGVTENGQVIIDSRTYDVPPGGIKNCIDGTVTTADTSTILPGSDAYLGPDKLYLAGRRWEATGVQSLTTSHGNLFLRINNEARTGGYYLNRRGATTLHGKKVNPSTLTPGFTLTGTINPSTTTLWQVSADYKRKDGFITQIDLEQKKIWLLGMGQPLTYSSQVAITFADNIIDADLADLPYGAAEKAELKALVPGMAVNLIIDPKTNQVEYIAVKREMALGRVIEVTSESLTLSTGETYTLFPGASVKLNGEPVDMEAINEGDWVALNLMLVSHEIIELKAYTDINYGRVLYISGDHKTVYLMDYVNEFRVYEINSETQVFRWGLPVSVSTLSPGDWVRLQTVPGGDVLARVDATSPSSQESKVLADVNSETGVLYCQDGSRYLLTNRTLVTVDGYRVAADFLPSGLTVNLTSLPGDDKPILARVEARSFNGSKPPQLKVSYVHQKEGLLLKGTSTADLIFLNYEDGKRDIIPVDNRGNFYWTIDVKERNVLLVAFNRTSGSVTAKKIELNNEKAGFWDTHGHWAEADIIKMFSAGLIAGYEDGSFRPNNPVSRAELVTLLVRLAGWEVPKGEKPECTDLAKVPSWAWSTVAVAQEKGLIVGYEDGSLRVNQPVNRVEAAAFFIRLLGDNAPEPAASLPYKDFNQIPAWGREVVAQAYEANLMRGETVDTFAPLSPFTRAQAAAVMARLREN